MAKLSHTALPGPAPHIPRRRPDWCRRVFLLLLILAVLVVLLIYLLLFQVKLLAWLIVGAALTVVFSTPCVCVIGLFVLYTRALSHMGQARHKPPQQPTQPAKHTSETVVVGEIVFDD